MKKILLLALLSITAIFLPSDTNANNDNQFITIVNPVRISKYTQSPKDSISAQYEVIKKNDLPATWLLTFDALTDDGVNTIVNQMNNRQEIGVFLEITPNLSEKAKVEYNETGSWHHATSVFLSGYIQEERKKLIDTIFDEFNERFGYYPTSVGSWWIDSYSLSYMKEKYGITANLGCSDQFSTDGYQLWGQYWSTPFYPSKFHAGIPASTIDTKLDIVTILWAPRDPLNGYKSSLFSTQDYFRPEVGQDIEYFEKLINLFAKKNDNEFGQITVGLEGDFPPSVYETNFTKQMELISKLKDTSDFRVTNMAEFSKWYRESFSDLSPAHIIKSKDLLGTNRGSFWFQSPRYRLGLVYEEGDDVVKIRDFRSFHKDMTEPYYQSPNREFNLSINIPSHLDEMSSMDNIWELNLGKITEITDSTLKFTKGEIIFSDNDINIKGENIIIPKIIGESPSLTVVKLNNEIEISINDNWLSGYGSSKYSDLSSEATHVIKSRKLQVVLLLVIMAVFVFIVFVIRSKKTVVKKGIVIIGLMGLLAIPAIYWYKNNLITYHISQGEIDALYHLSVLSGGKVFVYDNECFQCEYHTNDRPAVFANKRSYVKKYGKHPIVYTKVVFESEDRNKVKEDIEKNNIQYIYLVKYEEYIEKLPLSPGDYGMQKIYANANAEIWKKVKE